jgi:hypothetical protein
MTFGFLVLFPFLIVFTCAVDLRFSSLLLLRVYLFKAFTRLEVILRLYRFLLTATPRAEFPLWSRITGLFRALVDILLCKSLVVGISYSIYILFCVFCDLSILNLYLGFFSSK